MSGAVNTVGKLLNSTAGRVVAGLATGGLSEAGRAASGVARRSGVDPTVSAGIGYLAGGGSTGTTSTGALGSNSPALVGPAKAGGVTAATTSVNATNTESQREVDRQLGDATKRLTASPARQTDPRVIEEASRRRARESADRLGNGGRRRASDALTSLGGY